jgi:hypothetical protein
MKYAHSLKRLWRFLSFILDNRFLLRSQMQQFNRKTFHSSLLVEERVGESWEKSCEFTFSGVISSQ